MTEKIASNGAVRYFLELAENQYVSIDFRDFAIAITQLQSHADALAEHGVPTRPYKTMIDNLIEYVVRRQTGNNADAVSHLLVNNLGILEMLEYQFGSLEPEIDNETKVGIQEFLNLTRVALLEDQDMPINAKHYLVSIMRHVESCLDEFSIYGDFDLRNAVERLMGVLHAVVPDSEKRSGKWDAVFKWTVKSFFGGLLAASGAAVLPTIETGVLSFLESPVAVIAPAQDVPEIEHAI